MTAYLRMLGNWTGQQGKRESHQVENVVKILTNEIETFGRNITDDNCFTSYELVMHLVLKDISYWNNLKK